MNQWFLFAMVAMPITTLACNIAFLRFLARKGILKKNGPTEKTP